MMTFLAAAIAAAPAPPAPPRNPVAALVEARATVRIVAGARVHFQAGPGPGERGARDTFIRSAGATEPARLVEFE